MHLANLPEKELIKRANRKSPSDKGGWDLGQTFKKVLAQKLIISQDLLRSTWEQQNESTRTGEMGLRVSCQGFSSGSVITPPGNTPASLPTL